jgi:hypothetical protein
MKNTSKARISFDCSPEERALIKALASLENKTISDYILSLAKTKMSEFSSWRAQAQKGNETTDDTDDFLKAIEGIA